MGYTAEKNLERCMLDYGGRRTVPEYMNNTCKLWDFTKRGGCWCFTKCGAGVAY